MSLSDECMRTVIHDYTREAGVRNLEREIGTICRKVATELAQARKDCGQEIRHSPQGPGEIPGHREIPQDDQGIRERNRPRQWSRGHDARWRPPARRGDDCARQRQAHPHGQARRSHAGVGQGGHELHPLARRVTGPGERLQHHGRYPRALSRGRNPQGWSVGRHHDGYRHHLAHSCAFRCARMWR